MAFRLLFMIMYLMMSDGVESSQRNDSISSSRPKSKWNDGESGSCVSYSTHKSDLSFDRFTVRSGIHEQSLEHQEFDIFNGFLGA